MKVHFSTILVFAHPHSDIRDWSAFFCSRLVESAVQVIQKYEFNGLDIDWEFPAWHGMPLADQENFISLLRELRKAFDNPDTFGTKNHILLTAAVAAPVTIVETSYKVPEMAQ